MPPANPRIGTLDRPIAGVLAWLFPGVGHLFLGQRAKGLVLLIAITTLYLLGVLIGGLDVIDANEDWLWFIGQMFFGPVTVVLHLVRADLEKNNGEFLKSIGRVNEIGTLYCAMAGLLNLLAILDVLLPRSEQPEDDTPEPALRGRVVQREDAT